MSRDDVASNPQPPLAVYAVDAVDAAGGARPADETLVLVVDDTEGNRYTVSRLLRGAGMRVREAESGAEAMRALEEATPDLVVLDINLPDASGYDLCRVIKSDATLGSIPVMHVTASYVTSADHAFGLEHGADAYLTHPLDPDVFVATARALLRAEGERGRQVQVEQRARRVAEGVAARATLLQDLTAALARTMSAAEVSQVVLTRAFAALDAAVGMLAVVTPEGGTLELLGAANVPERAGSEWRHMPLDAASPMADAVRAAQAVALSGRSAIATAYPAWDRDVVALLTDVSRTLYAAPMVLDRGEGQRVLGAMLFLWPYERAVGATEVALIGAVADQCALALERARLYAAERVARADAEEANAAKSQFLANMSHELRTPLNAIGGYAELMALGIRGPLTAEQREDLARIQANQQHLLGLINEVLNYARLETGSVLYDVTRVDLDAMVASIEPLVAPQLAARQLEYTVAPCDEALAAHADPDKVRQVLLNLLSNAVKFTAPGGRIEVACGGTATHVTVRVRDSGVGIASDQLDRVFEPFVQVNARLTRTQDGVGLGLAISRDLARGMGGDLTAESEVDVGSTFTLKLPRA
jgi:signal transduction histidine kinase